MSFLFALVPFTSPLMILHTQTHTHLLTQPQPNIFVIARVYYLLSVCVKEELLGTWTTKTNIIIDIKILSELRMINIPFSGVFTGFLTKYQHNIRGIGNSIL